MKENTRFLPQGVEVAERILVPREVANADSVYLVSWLIKDGEFADAGLPICEIETSKALLSVETKHAGYLVQCAEVGEEVSIGNELGYLTVCSLKDSKNSSATTANLPTEGVKFSAKARQKLDQLGLAPSLFAGRGLVRESDVVSFASSFSSSSEVINDPKGQFHLQSLGVIQRRVARIMEQSLAEIPVSYLEQIIDLAPVRERVRSLVDESKTLISVVDLLVHAVARACLRFPDFNSCLTKDYSLQIYDNVNVGLAVDVENDLFVVVVKEASQRSPDAIAKELRSLQYLAQRRQLTAAQVSGGTITVTSLLGMGVTGFQPIPYIQQAAIVGITDSNSEKDQATLTLGFDHRIANGTVAAGFLCAIRDLFQGHPGS